MIRYRIIIRLLTVAILAAVSTGLSSKDHSGRVTLVAIGDVLLDRGVADQIEKNGLAYPFARVSTILSSADIAFANLECPITEGGDPARKRYSFQADPATGKCLQLAGLDIVSCANNHSMDCGRSGLTDTMENLSKIGIRWCGAGANRTDAEKATVMVRNGISIAFVGFCEFLPEGLILNDDRPSISLATDGAVRRAVAAAKTKADIVIASFHWGVEFRETPTQLQRQLSMTAVESGADLILGHHPHVLQGIKIVSTNRKDRNEKRTALIAYSLGNFVFDQAGKNRDETAILRCTFTRSGLSSAGIVPMKISACRPSLAPAKERRRILDQLARHSQSLGTTIHSTGIIDLRTQSPRGIGPDTKVYTRRM